MRNLRCRSFLCVGLLAALAVDGAMVSRSSRDGIRAEPKAPLAATRLPRSDRGAGSAASTQFAGGPDPSGSQPSAAPSRRHSAAVTSDGDWLQSLLLRGDRLERDAAIREARHLIESDREWAAALLGLALTDEEPRLRAKAVYGLTSLGGYEAAAALALAAADPQAWVRAEAVYSLATIRNDLSVRLLESALQDPEPNVREAAILGLADVAGRASVWALATAARDPEPLIREQAVEALGAIGGDAAVETIRFARGDPSPIVRQAAEQALQDAE